MRMGGHLFSVGGSSDWWGVILEINLQNYDEVKERSAICPSCTTPWHTHNGLKILLRR